MKAVKVNRVNRMYKVHSYIDDVKKELEYAEINYEIIEHKGLNIFIMNIDNVLVAYSLIQDRCYFKETYIYTPMYDIESKRNQILEYFKQEDSIDAVTMVKEEGDKTSFVIEIEIMKLDTKRIIENITKHLVIIQIA